MNNGKSIVINGGHQTRDFVYVDDVVNCLYRSLEVCLASSTCEQINVLTGYSVSIDELVIMLSKDIMVDIDKIYQDLPEGDPEQSNGTTDKMGRILGIDQHGMIRIAEGLSKTIKFQRKKNFLGVLLKILRFFIFYFDRELTDKERILIWLLSALNGDEC